MPSVLSVLANESVPSSGPSRPIWQVTRHHLEKAGWGVVGASRSPDDISHSGKTPQISILCICCGLESR